MSDFRKLAQDIGSAPLGDLISSVGKGVAEAQAALDAGSLEQTLALYDQGDDLQKVMRETGYRPTFYTIPETEGELKLSMTITGRSAARPPAPAPTTATVTSNALSSTALLARSRMIAPKIYAAPVDGRYQNSFNYSSQVSATIKFKIVAVPPPTQAEEARVVPDFSGLTVDVALGLADSFDLGLEGIENAAEGARVVAQDPAPGALSTAGSLIGVTLTT